MNDDLERRLEGWGRSNPPAVDQTFADNLESELRRIGAQAPRSKGRSIWQPLAGVAAAAVLVVAGFFAAAGDSGGEIVVLSASEDAVVILPDGTEFDSPVDLDLPDGTRIEVGPAGSATVGDVILAAGSVAEIVDGRVELVRSPRVGPSPPPTTGPPISRPSTTARPTTTQPRTTAGRPTTVADRSSTSRVRSTTTTAVDIRVVLTATIGRTEVQLEWTAPDLDRIAGWEVRAQSGDREATVAVVRDPGARQLTVARPDVVVTYRVFALDAGGAVVAESNAAVAG